MHKAVAERPPLWVGHISLDTDRLDETDAFMETLGMRSIFKSDTVAILELRGGTHIVLNAKSVVEPRGAGFDLMVEELDTTHRRFQELGLKVSEISRGKIHDSFVITEPAGNTIKFNSTHVGDLPV